MKINILELVLMIDATLDKKFGKGKWGTDEVIMQLEDLGLLQEEIRFVNPKVLS